MTTSGFQRMGEDVKNLLQAMGLPVVVAEGEAEATCAQLEREGYVQGVTSCDGDALVFGARRVFKDLHLHTQRTHERSYHRAEMVELVSVEETLGLHRSGMVALALLCGGDYLTKGLSSVGPRRAVRLVKILIERRRQHGGALAGATAVGESEAAAAIVEDLKKVLSQPVNREILDEKEGCRTCATCRHGDVKKSSHGAQVGHANPSKSDQLSWNGWNCNTAHHLVAVSQGCMECGTHPKRCGGNGRGGCQEMDVTVGGCPCPGCTGREKRFLMQVSPWQHGHA